MFSWKLSSFLGVQRLKFALLGVIYGYLIVAAETKKADLGGNFWVMNLSLGAKAEPHGGERLLTQCENIWFGRSDPAMTYDFSDDDDDDDDEYYYYYYYYYFLL